MILYIILVGNNIPSLSKIAFKTFKGGRRKNEGIRLSIYFFLGAAFFTGFFGIFLAADFLTDISLLKMAFKTLEFGGEEFSRDERREIWPYQKHGYSRYLK